MIDFIPIYEYTHYFDITILIMVMVIVWQCHTGNVLKSNFVNLNATWGVFITIFLILYMGLRPISSAFGDTMNYAEGFYEWQNTSEPFKWEWNREWLFTI